MLDAKLYDAQLYAWYAEPENYVQTIRPTYAKMLPFSIRYILPPRLRNQARARLSSYGIVIKDVDNARVHTGSSIAPHRHHGPSNPATDVEKATKRSILEEIEPEVYKIAKDCYEALSRKLGSKDYFFGSK